MAHQKEIKMQQKPITSVMNCLTINMEEMLDFLNEVHPDGQLQDYTDWVGLLEDNDVNQFFEDITEKNDFIVAEPTSNIFSVRYDPDKVAKMLNEVDALDEMIRAIGNKIGDENEYFIKQTLNMDCDAMSISIMCEMFTEGVNGIVHMFQTISAGDVNKAEPEEDPLKGHSNDCFARNLNGECNCGHSKLHYQNISHHLDCRNNLHPLNDCNCDELRK